MSSIVVQKVVFCFLFFKCSDSLRLSGQTILTETEAQGCIDCEGFRNDPKVTNLAGQSFDLERTGTYPFVLISRAPENEVLLSLHATLDRGTKLCKTTYVKNISFHGDWIHELANTSTIEFRAVKASLKEDALEIKTDQEWQKLADFGEHPWITLQRKRGPFHSRHLTLQIHGVTFRISNDVHTSSGASFLNLEVTNLRALEQPKFHVGGLLGHEYVNVPKLNTHSHDDQCTAATKEFKFLSTSFSKKGDCCTNILSESDLKARLRAAQASHSTGKVIISLIWNQGNSPVDLALVVECPGGKLWYKADLTNGLPTSCGSGVLHVDTTDDMTPIHTMVWNTPPNGEYKVSVETKNNEDTSSDRDFTVMITKEGHENFHENNVGKIWVTGNRKWKRFSRQVKTFSLKAS